MNIMKIDFNMNIARMDYFKRYLICLLGIMVFAFGAGAGLELMSNEIAQAIVIFIAVVGIGYAYIYGLAALVGRFRNMGVEKNSSMIFAVIGFAIAQGLFAPLMLIPFFWSPKA